MSSSIRPALRAFLVAVLSVALIAASDCDDIESRQVAQSTITASTTPTGASADGACTEAVISDDGRRIVFISSATNLVADQGLPDPHVYLKDRVTGSVELLTRHTFGPPVAAGPSAISLSPNGRHVAFLATKALTPSPTPPVGAGPNLYVRDLELRVTIAILSPWPNKLVGLPSVSDNGDVVFESDSTNLPIATPATTQQVYLARANQIQVQIVSHAAGLATQSNGLAYNPRISADGTKISYHSTATNVVPGDTDTLSDVYLATVGPAVITSELVSLNPAGVKGNDASQQSDISPDGRYVSFLTFAPNMAPGFLNIMRRDLVAGTTTWVTRGADGLGPDALTGQGRVANDGSVVFFSLATNLTPEGSGSVGLWLAPPGGGFRPVSVNDFGLPASPNTFLGSADLSSNGPWVVFVSPATNLAAADGNGHADAFVRGPFGP